MRTLVIPKQYFLHATQNHGYNFNKSFSYNVPSKLKQHRRNMSFLNGTNSTYVEEMYKCWLDDPKSVHSSWNAIFKNYEGGTDLGSIYVAPERFNNRQIKHGNIPKTPIRIQFTETETITPSADLAKVFSLIKAYQSCGHLRATVDPLALEIDERSHFHKADMLDYTFHGLSETDLNKYFEIPFDIFQATDGTPIQLRDLLKKLDKIYCGNVGVEYKYILDWDTKKWIQGAMEDGLNFRITDVDRSLLLERLTQATLFERYLAKKYPSEKRFGLEGLETLIPCLKIIIDEYSAYGVDHVLIGTAHRGRLNILANVVNSPLQEIFCRFNTDIGLSDQFSGDVKYHLGCSHRVTNEKTGKPIHLCIVANPSHLEAVNPVVLGKTRALQNLLNDNCGDKVANIIIHGDAAFAGQGIVYESFQLDKLKNYSSYGSVHIVVNNQIGFTTEPNDSRSSHYASDVAKILDIPIFHVNANDPEAVYFVSKIASTYRNKFKKSVVIDLIGYRRNGHNESDNPFFTQPLMYRKISQIESVLELYSNELKKSGIIKPSIMDDFKVSYSNKLDSELRSAKKITEISNSNWLDSPMVFDFKESDKFPTMKTTGVSKKLLTEFNNKCNTLPEGFEPHPSFKRVIKQRMDLIDAGEVDWALGEISAFSTLLSNGIHVRLSGQDSERGTFSHRHHVLHAYAGERQVYTPLKHVSPNQAPYIVCNSPLSEYAVLGFDLGYSIASSNFLVCWEAQFGDFCNTAQCIFDQFIASGYHKWLRQSGLVALLPHGYDGMGPEHSSARIERFLQLSSEDVDTFPEYLRDEFHVMQLHSCNWIVANCSTPANLFHILRRQVACNFRRPLVLFTPKNLLRLEQARSSFDEMDEGTIFQRVIPDYIFKNSKDFAKVKRLILCSGKLYYELVAERSKHKLDSQVAIIRIEQLSPFPFDLVQEELLKFTNACVVWAQEEPKNQGPWSFIERCLLTTLKSLADSRKVYYFGRKPCATTATGIKKIHTSEQEALLKNAITSTI